MILVTAATFDYLLNIEVVYIFCFGGIRMVEGSEKTSPEHETDRVKKPRKKQLTVNQARIIRLLVARGFANEKELRIATGIDASSLSRTISHLHKDKLIVRNIQEEDARQRVLSATEIGRRELRIWEKMLGLPAPRKRRKRGSPGQTALPLTLQDPERSTVDGDTPPRN